MKQTLARSVALTIFALLAAGAADAAAVRSGPTIGAIVAASRGNSVAYDSINHVYLVVSAQGIVSGRFVDRNGSPIGAQFVIQGNTGFFGMYPHAAFSPDANGGAGGFLVTWSESDTKAAAYLHGRMVAFGANGAYGGDNILSTDGTWWEEGAYAAYSKAHQEFFVVYRTNGSYIIRALRVGNNALPLGPIFTVSQTNQYEDNPSVAYNPVADNYLVCWKGWAAAGFGFVDCRFVAGGTNTLSAGPIRLRASAGTWITDTTYNPTTNQFLVSWRDSSASIASITGRLVNADGSLPGGAFPISTLWQAYDALGVAYNTLTHTFFMVSHCSNCTDDGGVELGENGQPIDNGFKVTLTPGAMGNFYPQIAAGTDDPRWLVSASTSFTQTSVQLLAGTAVGPSSNPQMAVETPGTGSIVPTFNVSGWAVDLGSQDTSGVDIVDIWAWPASGAPPIFVAETTTANPRPDIATLYGSHFIHSGYSVNVSGLALGSYTLSVYMHSTVTNTFNAVRSVNITISVPAGETMRASDFDADRRSEMTVYNKASGVWSTLKSASGYASASSIPWGGTNLTPVPGDFDGDGKTDLGVYNQQTGDWYVLLSSSGYTTSLSKNAGGPGWTPVPGDYDGDGKTDFAVYNTSTGLWYALKSSTGYTSVVSISWGGAGYTAAPADFDGDGKTDLVAYDTSGGNWYVLLSSSGYTTALTRNAGGAGYDPVPADYDGDGKADFAVYNGSTGLWYALKSGNAYMTVLSVSWGGAGYTPVRGDFDGDGKADLAVYHVQSGNWYILLSSTGYTSGLSKNWGGIGYAAVPPFQ